MRLAILGMLLAVNASGDVSKALVTAVHRVVGPDARIEVRALKVSGLYRPGTQVRLVNPERPFGLVAFEGEGFTGSAEVRVFATVAVAALPLADGDRMGETNVRFEERELNRFAAGGYFRESDSLSRLTVRGHVKPGTVLGLAQTQAPVLVQPGQPVDLIVDRSGLKVTAKVEALQRGRDQEWIRVRNPSTRRVLQARVVGAGTVTF